MVGSISALFLTPTPLNQSVRGRVAKPRLVNAAKQPSKFSSRSARGGRSITLLVAHFKAQTAGRPTRAEQHRALIGAVRDVRESEPNLIVMGDFNATEPADRDDLAELASSTDMQWATSALPCSAFWQREDDCPISRLDDVLSWQVPVSVTAHGGCEARDQCPLYAKVVSDHCPVVLELR